MLIARALKSSHRATRRHRLEATHLPIKSLRQLLIVINTIIGRYTNMQARNTRRISSLTLNWRLRLTGLLIDALTNSHTNRRANHTGDDTGSDANQRVEKNLSDRH